MIRHRSVSFVPVCLLAALCCFFLTACPDDASPAVERGHVSAGLTAAERETVSTALEPSESYPRDHIVLVWPEKLDAAWYPESGVKGPDGLADWLETCYGLCRSWLKIDPDEQWNSGRDNARRARLVFVHNGMRDYNFGGTLPRAVIGLRDFASVGTEDWFGWLTHELCHDFLLLSPGVAGTPEDNEWHEAICDYLRYWLLKDSGMPEAAGRWLDVLRRASPLDKYQGGAKLVMDCHDRLKCDSPGEFWAKIGGEGVSKALGRPPWADDPPQETVIPGQGIKLEFEAVIDGAGSFTFRDGKIFYEHFTWEYPAQVKIDGRSWDDLDKPFEWAGAADFASAKAFVRSGRDTIVLNPHDDRLVLYFDDFEDSSANYRLTIVMEPERQPAPQE